MRESAGSQARKGTVRGAQRGDADRGRAVRQLPSPAPLTRDYLRRRPFRPRLVFGGRPGAVSRFRVARGRRPDPQARSWRLARRPPVAGLTASNTVVQGMLGQLSSAGHRGLAYLVGRVSTSAAAGRGHDSRARHCPHTRFTRRRTSIASSQALRRPVNRIYSGNAKKTDTKASILLSGERAEVA